MVDHWVSLVAVGLALLLGAMSPGPSFLMVARSAVIARRNGLASAAGMAMGGATLALLAMGGLHAAILAAPRLFAALQVLGGAYLLLIAWRIWQGAREGLPDGGLAVAAKPVRSFAAAFGTQVSNPKTLLVYASVLATAFPASAPAWFPVAVVGVVFCVELGWYILVAMILSGRAARFGYLRVKRWVDRLASIGMAILAVRVILAKSA